MTHAALSRRDLLSLGAGAAGTLGARALGAWPLDAAAGRAVADLRFPSDFRWGTATSAYQIEGAVSEDGRGRSIWDTFAHTPGRIKDGSTGDVACDHYHRYRDDVRTMKGLGLNAYRFSVAWPRLFPAGRGAPNAKGLAFYDRLVDELRASDIEPFATLFHWDLPQALQDRGGWEARDTASAFADYAGFVAERLSDRVRSFFTINEFLTFVENGHGRGVHAPGLTLPPARLNQVRHHALLGHGLAAQAIRARGRAGTRLGPAENVIACVPAVETPACIAATERATRDVNAKYLTAMLEGRYLDSFLAAAGPDAPRFTDADMRAIGTPVDFVGVNIYTPHFYVKETQEAPGYLRVPVTARFPHMGTSEWLGVGPEVAYWLPRQLASVWKVRDIYVTENGCSADDVVEADGSVNDIARVMYLRNHLAHLQRAIAEGVGVRGYFEWSLMDNFEWHDGYSQRFGIHYVDFPTQRRTPKLSAAYYREVVARNAVV